MAIRTPAHPGGFIKRNYLDLLGIGAAELAEALGVHKATLSRLLNEKADLSPGLAVRLSVVLGGSSASWMNMQTNHSLYRIVAEPESSLKDWRPGAVLKDGRLDSDAARHVLKQSAV